MQISKNLLIGMFFILYSTAFAQNQSSVKGKITDYNGEALPGIFVKLKNSNLSTASDNAGNYQMQNVPYGKDILVFSGIGIKKTERQININGAVLNLDIKLQPEVQQMETVQVNGKTKVQQIRESGFAVDAIDTKKLANTTADLNQVLNRTSGIRVRESGGMGSNFKFSLNGFSGDQVKFFMDGIPIESYGSSFTLNNIPVNLAERVEVYKGVVPIELGGDALGGAVNIVTNKSVNRFVDASYSVGSFNTHKLSVNTRFANKNGLVFNFNAFSNYSDNSYKVDVSVADAFTGSFGPVQSYKHFHDGYRQGAIMAEVGIKNKKAADYLLFGLSGSINKKEIQQGATMLAVVGEAFTDSKNVLASLKYKKTNLFTKNLTARLSASYNVGNQRSIDTSSARFDWSGKGTVKNYTSGGEINPDKKTIIVFNINSFQSNTNLDYALNKNNSFAFNHTFIGYKRRETDDYNPEIKSSKPYLNKSIMGISYNLSALNKRLSYTAFTKIFDLQSGLKTENDGLLKGSFHKIGYGTAAAYYIFTNQLQVKASYEHAYRLQSANELLGDPPLGLPNSNLQPESSDNFNLGLSFKQTYDSHHFGVQSNLIYRNAKDFIQNVAQGVYSQSVNKTNIQVTGVDAGVQYGYKNWLTFDINATYQQTVDMNPNGQYGTNQVNYLYRKQLPNVPILFGNADVGFYFKKLKYNHDALNLNLSSSFSDSYYLNYPTLGAPEYKKEIPLQLFHSVAMAYSLNNGRYNIALECRNITDEDLYDYFNVQKPGRSFMLKLRYSLL